MGWNNALMVNHTDEYKNVVSNLSRYQHRAKRQRQEGHGASKLTYQDGPFSSVVFVIASMYSLCYLKKFCSEDNYGRSNHYKKSRVL
jgi:hypothetical protein